MAHPPIQPDTTCDAIDWGLCDGKPYTEVNPFVECRQKRPSDPSDMCCVLAGHLACMGGTVAISNGGGVATPQQWEDWIESPEAAKAGFLFLT